MKSLEIKGPAYKDFGVLNFFQNFAGKQLGAPTNTNTSNEQQADGVHSAAEIVRES